MAKSKVKKTPKPKRKPTKTIKKTSSKLVKKIKTDTKKPVKTVKISKSAKTITKPKKQQPKQQIDCEPCRLKSKSNQSNRIFKYI